MTLVSGAYTFKWWQVFVTYEICYVIILYYSNTLIFNRIYYYPAFDTTFVVDQIHNYRQQHTWLFYTIFSEILSLKFVSVSALIYTGAFLYDQTITYQDCLKIVLLAEVSSILATIIIVIYFFFHPPVAYDAFRLYSPFSIIQLIDAKHLPVYLIYPIKLLNVFELGYWSILVAGVAHFTKESVSKSLKIVATGYGVGLILWALFVAIMQVQFS